MAGKTSSLKFTLTFWALVITVCVAVSLITSVLLSQANIQEPFAIVPEHGDQGAKVRISDEISMQDALNSTGSKIVSTNATTQCTVNDIPVNEMEMNTNGDIEYTSCIVSRSLLKPIKRNLTGDVATDARALQDMLRPGHMATTVVGAYCRPESTLCTVEFNKNASTSSLQEYNSYLTKTFGFSSVAVSNISGSGTMYVMMPDSSGGLTPKRMTIRVDGEKNKHFLIYKYCGKASEENPLDLWRSAGRNVDGDVALNASDFTTNYCSDMLNQTAWEAFMFSHIIVEVRRGPETLSTFKFRATKDRMQWFHPTHLVSAYFGSEKREAPRDFPARKFSRFRMEDINDDRLYWTILDEVPGSSSGTSKPVCTTEGVFFLAAPYKSTTCSLHERAHGRIITSVSENPVSIDNPSQATHMCIWMMISSDQSAGNKSSVETSPYTPSNTNGPITKSLIEQSKPTNMFVPAALKPSKDLPCIISSYTNGGPSCADTANKSAPDIIWEVKLPELRPYTREELVDLTKSNRQPLIRSLSNGQSPSLITANYIRFHKSYRIVLIGDGRDFSTDAEYIAVLQDNKVMESYGFPSGPVSAQQQPNVRYVDGRTGIINTTGNSKDNDGSFLDACLSGEWEGSARSIIVEKVTEVPLQASRKCNMDSVHEVMLHMGNYNSFVQHADIMGNNFDVRTLRSFKVGMGYVAILYSEKSFKGSVIGSYTGPSGVCLQDHQMVQSFKVVHASVYQSS